MPTHALTRARIGQQSDGPLGGLYLGEVVNELSPFTLPRFATVTDRDAAYSQWLAADTANALDDGFYCHVQSSGVRYRYDSVDGGWVIDGGRATPVACPMQGGWNTVPGHLLKMQRITGDRAKLWGWASNVLTFTPNPTGPAYVASLPGGLTVTTSQVFEVPYVGSVYSRVLCTLHTDGRLSADNNGGVSIPANSNFFFDGIELSLTYTG